MTSPYIERITQEPWEAVLFRPPPSATPQELIAAGSALLFCVQQVDDALSLLTDADAIHEFSVDRDLARAELKALGGRLAGRKENEFEIYEKETLAAVRTWLHRDREDHVDALLNRMPPEIHAAHYMPVDDIGLDGPEREGLDFA
jgi:hypothetical protein